jgi:hypothetical protein
MKEKLIRILAPKKSRNAKSQPAAESTPIPAAPPLPKKEPAMEPEIAAVIAAVIDIELRLHGSAYPGRLTYQRPGRTQGWCESARYAVNPFQGGKIR